MHRTRLTAPALLLGAATLLPGCLGSDGSVSPGDIVPTTDEEAIGLVMGADETNTEMTTTDVLFMNEDASGTDGLAPISTCRWVREPTDVNREIQILIQEPAGAMATASVTVGESIVGILHLFACENDPPLAVDKNFDDAGQLQMLFERVRPVSEDRRHRGWRLAAVSGIELASEGTTRNINSVRVVAGDVDQTFTDMSALVRVADVLRLPAGVDVQVTVNTGDANDSAWLHVHRARRTAMTSNGDGTFTGHFVSSDRPGPRHFAVDVLSNGTLYDDVAPYDNVAWGMLYLVEGEHDGGMDGGGRE